MDMCDDFNVLKSFRKDIREIRSIRLRFKTSGNNNRRLKLYKVRQDPMSDLTEEEFKTKYRFSKENMLKIINMLRDDLQVDTRGGSIPVELQVTAAIRYWGRHEIQEDCAKIHGISQQSLSRLCKNVAVALAEKSSTYIKMPANINEEVATIKKFQDICGFPQVTGAIDCTHIKIRKVSGDTGQSYINRKGHYSLNTQIVCNADLKICDIVCNYGGSTQDATIFRESALSRRFEENYFKGKLIADSEYPGRPYLLTPVLQPKTEAERRYNNSHIQTRNTIERCLGLLKQRFKVLQEVMRGNIETIKSTIVACAVLHNLAIEFEDTLDDDIECSNVKDIIQENEKNSVLSFNNYADIHRNIFIQNNF